MSSPSLFFPAVIDFLLLFLAQVFVQLLCDLELEENGYGSLFGWIVRVNGWIVRVLEGDSCLLLFPTSEDDRAERLPSIRTIGLDWRKFPLLVVEFQITANLRGLPPSTVAEPVFDLLYGQGKCDGDEADEIKEGHTVFLAACSMTRAASGVPCFLTSVGVDATGQRSYQASKTLGQK